MPAPAHSPFARVTKRGGHRITFTQRRAGCTLAGCLCASLAALCLTLGAAAGVYYGVRFLEGQRTAERVYRGAFTVLEGDKFSESLSNSLADDFVRKADAYRAKLDRLFNSSAAFRGTEVIAFQRREDRELTVHFNVHFSPYGPVDAGELYLAMADELLRGRLGVFQGLKVDPESLSLQERRATASLPESWTPRRRYPGYLAGLSTSRPAVGRQAELLCEPLTLDHCRASLPYNSTAYPNAVGHATARDVYRDLVAYRQLADSECHPLAAELVCRLLQPQCDDAERRVVLPCREFCQEFWSSCQQQMPLAIAGHIDCGRLPEYSAAGSCHTKPGCANELKARGKESHICDGVVDCPDFSDETSCDNCGPGLLHCGDRQCVDIAQRCDARLDCDNGADEQNCLSLPELGGYLRAYQRGHFRKVCVDGLPEGRRRDSLLKQLADTACAALNLGPPSRVELHHDGNSSDSYLQLLDPPGLRFSSPGACRSDLVVYLLCSPPECGQSSALPTTQEVRHGDWPWHVMLLQAGRHVCDGTLVADRWVLTAGACLPQGRDPSGEWQARLGSVRKESASPFDVRAAIAAVLRSADGVLALLRLDAAVPQSRAVRPACLPRTPPPQAGRCATLAYGVKGDQLEQVNLEASECGPAVFCGRQASCVHESLAGRQLMCWHGDRWQLAGVAAEPCSGGAQRFHGLGPHLAWAEAALS
ncbi:atrial natriuretic peptide-converting enzyme-like isoform X1 [Amblyomma americanum]